MARRMNVQFLKLKQLTTAGQSLEPGYLIRVKTIPCWSGLSHWLRVFRVDHASVMAYTDKLDRQGDLGGAIAGDYFEVSMDSIFEIKPEWTFERAGVIWAATHKPSGMRVHGKPAVSGNADGMEEEGLYMNLTVLNPGACMEYFLSLGGDWRHQVSQTLRQGNRINCDLLDISHKERLGVLLTDVPDTGDVDGFLSGAMAAAG